MVVFSKATGPKYLNSPATPLFDKSRTLYLIDRAKGPIRKSGQAVIVEGYTDALMAHQAGFDNVVASLGTALTPGQVALLTRYASRIVLAYDVDAAGEKAGTLGVTSLAGADRPAPGGHLGRQARGCPRRAPAGRQGPRRSRSRGPGGMGGGGREGEAARRVPDRPSRGAVRSEDIIGAYRVRGSGHARHPATSPTRCVATRRSARSAAPPGSRSASCSRSSSARRGTRSRRGRRRGTAAAGESRITADAVLASPDALPIRDILRAITPVESELLRLLLLVPDQQLRVVDELGPDQLPSTVARELFRAIVLQRAPDDHGVHPPFDSAALLLGLDDETAALARALYAEAGPDPRTLGSARLDYEISRLLLELEDDQLRDRSDYNEAAQSEAERAGRPRGHRSAHVRTTSDQRSAPVTRPAPRPDPASRQPPEVTHVR